MSMDAMWAGPGTSAALAVALGLLGGLWARSALARRWHHWRKDRSRRARFERAAQAEEDARGLLQRHGYEVLDDQAQHTWTIRLNGEPHEVAMRADYLVRRRGKRYVAEVKSGRLAPRISTAATRRQLLEYLIAYPVAGVLLVDMEDEQIYEVTFPDLPAARPSLGQRLGWLLAGGMLGALAVALARLG